MSSFKSIVLSIGLVLSASAQAVETNLFRDIEDADSVYGKERKVFDLNEVSGAFVFQLSKAGLESSQVFELGLQRSWAAIKEANNRPAIFALVAYFRNKLRLQGGTELAVIRKGLAEVDSHGTDLKVTQIYLTEAGLKKLNFWKSPVVYKVEAGYGDNGFGAYIEVSETAYGELAAEIVGLVTDGDIEQVHPDFIFEI